MRPRPFRAVPARLALAPALALAAFGSYSPCSAQPAPAVEAAPAAPAVVQPALDAMGAAVVAGDVEAYLATVARRSVYFLVEQREWAKDLTKAETRPKSFSAKAVGAGSVAAERRPLVGLDGTMTGPAEVEVWTGPVRFAWAMPGKGPAARAGVEASVEFEARFYKGEDGVWRYAGEALEVLETPAAAIHYPKGAEGVARQVAEGFPAAKKHDDAFFGKAIDRVEEIRLFDRRDVLQFSVYPSMFQTDTTLSGWSEPGQSIKFLTTYARDARGWTAAFAHEYGHVCTWEMGEKASGMPWWASEGIAELAAEEFTGGRPRVDRIIVRWARDGKLAEWAGLADYRTTDQSRRSHPYHQGQHLVGFVSDTFGAEKRNGWIRAMAKGDDVEKATKGVLGMAFGDLDARWRAHVEGLVKAEAPPTPAGAPAK